MILNSIAPFAGMLDLVLKDEDQALKVTSAGLRMFERKDQKVEHCPHTVGIPSSLPCLLGADHDYQQKSVQQCMSQSQAP